VLCDIISNHVLPLACKTGDRWLASMGFWMLEKTDEAVAATVVSSEAVQSSHKQMVNHPQGTTQ
jgi:hypothetical protein